MVSCRESGERLPLGCRSRVDDQRKRDFAILDEMRDAFRDEESENIEREVARAIREVREARAASGKSGDSV